MELKKPLNIFEGELNIFTKQLETLEKTTINSEGELESAKIEYKNIKQGLVNLVRESFSDDLAHEMEQDIRTENGFRIPGTGSLAQHKQQFVNSIKEKQSALTYLMEIIKISDPLIIGKDFESERSEFTIQQKKEFLLTKLYSLRKTNKYWDTTTILKINQVGLDGYDEPRQLADSLKNEGLIDVIGHSQGVSAKITTEGKSFFEEYLNPRVVSQPLLEVEKLAIPNFIAISRINELKNLTSNNFDFKKLVKLCEEINDNFENENFLSVAMLSRSILDHVPPIFGYNTFNEVANNYGGQSFKKNMNHLNNSLRSIADSFLHMTIRKKEILPNSVQINFSQDIDVLLAEIIRKIHESS